MTHDPVLEGDQLLLLLLPALEVGVDQGLQLDQVLVLTFLLDVLQDKEFQRHSATRGDHSEIQNRHRSAYVKVHFLTIGDLGSAGPVEERRLVLVLMVFGGFVLLKSDYMKSKLT